MEIPICGEDFVIFLNVSFGFAAEAGKGTAAKDFHLRLRKTLHFLPTWPFSYIINVVAKSIWAGNKGNSQLDLAKASASGCDPY